MHVLIAGCGYVGTELAKRLLAEGHRVTGIRRRVELLPEGVKPLGIDLRRPAEWPDFDDDFDAVVFSASAAGRDEEGYRSSYVHAQRALRACLQGTALGTTQGPKRWIFTSSTGVYGQRDGSLVDEASPTEPSHWSGQVLLEGEAVALGEDGDEGEGGLVVRFSGLYGPGRDRLLRSVRDGRLALEDGPPRYMNRIHRDDAAACLHHLLDHPDPPRVLIASDPNPTPRNVVLQGLADLVGVELPEVGQQPLGPRARRSNKRCSSAALVASGFEFRFPSWKEGFASMLPG